jgi:hypothetical protein
MNESSLDRYAHVNPAFVAACLHWVSDGYEATMPDIPEGGTYLHPMWGMLSLAFLAPEGIRAELPRQANAKLAVLMNEKHPEWRAFAADAIRSWVAPFWEGARYGCARGILTFDTLRLRPSGTMQAPPDLVSLDLQKRAVTLGKLMGKEGNDGALALLFGVEVTR